MKNLVLTLIAVFSLVACEKEEMQAEQFSWVGEWNATNIVISTFQVDEAELRFYDVNNKPIILFTKPQ
ncbi:MAG: hypothetical protein Sapg2KO_10420 [Saprospiraceae bacterium]